MVVCGIIVAVCIFGSYRFGSSSAYTQGWAEGNSTGYLYGYELGHASIDNYAMNKFLQGNQTGWDSGYAAGYAAGIKANNGTG